MLAERRKLRCQKQEEDSTRKSSFLGCFKSLRSDCKCKMVAVWVGGCLDGHLHRMVFDCSQTDTILSHMHVTAAAANALLLPVSLPHTPLISLRLPQLSCEKVTRVSTPLALVHTSSRLHNFISCGKLTFVFFLLS